MREDLRNHAAHREDIRAPATISTPPNELLNIAGLVGREDSVRVAGRIRVDDLTTRNNWMERSEQRMLDDPFRSQIAGVALLRREEVGEVGYGLERERATGTVDIVFERELSGFVVAEISENEGNVR